eukprot:141151_1
MLYIIPKFLSQIFLLKTRLINKLKMRFTQIAFVIASIGWFGKSSDFSYTNTTTAPLQISCNDDEDCTVTCAGDESCDSATVVCPANSECDIDCDGVSACYEMKVIAVSSSKLSMERNGESCFHGGQLQCPNGGDCDVSFSGYESGYD